MNELRDILPVGAGFNRRFDLGAVQKVDIIRPGNDSGICQALPNYDALKAGDLLNLKGVHVILFEQFADRKRKALLAYEAGAPPSWKVLYNQLPLGHLKRLGYKPLRYQGIVDQPDDAAKLGLRVFEMEEVAKPESPAPEPEAVPAPPSPAASSAAPAEEQPASDERPSFTGPGTV